MRFYSNKQNNVNQFVNNTKSIGELNIGYIISNSRVEVTACESSRILLCRIFNIQTLYNAQYKDSMTVHATAAADSLSIDLSK